MRYNVTNDFVKIAETSGTIQNTSNIYTVEVSDTAEAGSGILLYPSNKISVASTELYLRCVDGGNAEVRVVPFEVDAPGGGENFSESYSDFTGATANAGGMSGLVPAPAIGDENACLHGDGTWSDDIVLPTVANPVDGGFWLDTRIPVPKFYFGGQNYLLDAELIDRDLPEKGKTLNDYTWAEISAISEAGKGAEYFDIGDYKEITLNGNIGGGLTFENKKLCVYILHFNYPMNGVANNNIIFGGFKTAGGTNVALCDSHYNTTLMNGIISFNMNHTGQGEGSTANGYHGTSFGGWKGTDLRYDILGATNTPPSEYNQLKSIANVGYNATAETLTNPKANTLLAALPADFRNVLKLWSRWIDVKGNKSNTESGIEETIDAVTLLAEFEVFGVQARANEYEQNHQTQMDYYKNGNSKIMYRHDSTSVAVKWWTSSPAKNSLSSLCYTTASGDETVYYADSVYSLAPAFKV